jgi:carbon storage regulator
MEYIYMKGVSMLVLSRQRDESIVIGKNREIKVMVLDIRGDKVRLGVTAPGDVPVHREEIAQRIDEHQQEQGRENGNRA